jgi:hypothetical protein
MKTKKQAYILLGSKVPIMNKIWERTFQYCSQDACPLILICGFPLEVAYYLDRIRQSGIEATVYSSDRSWDTFSNFSKDIASILQTHTISDTNFTLFAGTSHAWRIQRIVKYMRLWHSTFRSCSIQVIRDSKIPTYSMERIANVFYHFGYIGMYLLTALSYYRNLKKSSG